MMVRHPNLIRGNDPGGQVYLMLAGVAGVWLVVSPWLGSFAGLNRPAAVAWLAGTSLVAVAAVALLRPGTWGVRRALGVIALLLYLSPWLVGYTNTRVAADNAWFTSAVVAQVEMVAAIDALLSHRRGSRSGTRMEEDAPPPSRATPSAPQPSSMRARIPRDHVVRRRLANGHARSAGAARQRADV